MHFELKKLLVLKEKNMPGHTLKYVYAELWKVIARLLLNKDNNLITVQFKDVFIFNLDKRSFETLLLYLKIARSDLLIWSSTKKNIFTFLCIYMPFLIRYFIKKFNNLYITTDIQLANYNLIKIFKNSGKVFCVQHGYFPISNKGDIDGLNSDVYITRNKQQGNLIREAGYSGEIAIFNPLNNINFREKDLSNLIFIGPGFSHTPRYEDELLKILMALSELKNYSWNYRPHKRCSKDLLTKINNCDIRVDSSEMTSLNDGTQRIFLGVKSTMLLDAQEIGHNAVLIHSENLPRYFPTGVIKYEVKANNIDNLSIILKNITRS